jgi:hypothetical protein
VLERNSWNIGEGYFRVRISDLDDEGDDDSI